MATIERSKLHVEGNDDAHTIKHLLSQYGCVCLVKGENPSHNLSANAPEIVPVGSDTDLLEGMEISIRVSSGRAVGFVLDADEFGRRRWCEIRQRIGRVGLSLPNEIPVEGYVSTTSDYEVRVGVWLMPDNQRSGALEVFLKDLVDNNDSLLPIAKSSTRHAKRHGALFPDSRKDKAVVRTWLAWQEEPGLPYGLAVSKHYFRHDTDVAVAFVRWFKRVFRCG